MRGGLGWFRILSAIFPAHSTLMPDRTDFSLVRRAVACSSGAQRYSIDDSFLYNPPFSPTACGRMRETRRGEGWGSLRKNPPFSSSVARHFSQFTYRLLVLRLTPDCLLAGECTEAVWPHERVGTSGFGDNLNSFTEWIRTAAGVVGGGAGNAFCLLSNGKRLQRALFPGRARIDVSERSELGCATRCVPMYVCVLRGSAVKCRDAVDLIRPTRPIQALP